MVYDEIISETKFTMEQIRLAERHMIANKKMMGDPPLEEKGFKKAMLIIFNKMKVGLSFETVVELTWPKQLIESYGNAKKTGQGFNRTQMQYNGTHVIYRNKFDKHH